MRISLNNIAQIEKYLTERLVPSSKLLFEAHILVNPILAEDVRLQKIIYEAISWQGRKQLKAEIQAIEHHLFNTKTDFQKEVLNIFKKE